MENQFANILSRYNPIIVNNFTLQFNRDNLIHNMIVDKVIPACIDVFETPMDTFAAVKFDNNFNVCSACSDEYSIMDETISMYNSTGEFNSGRYFGKMLLSWFMYDFTIYDIWDDIAAIRYRYNENMLMAIFDEEKFLELVQAYRSIKIRIVK